MYEHLADNKMKKPAIVLLLAAIILVIGFFYPKINNIWDDSFTARASQYKNMDCSCIGFAKIKPGLSKSDTQIILCYGMPIKCQFSCKKIIDGNWESVSCDELD